FNLHHQGRNAWWILVTAAAAIAALAVWLRPAGSSAAASGPAPPFAQVQSVIDHRCVPCHSLHPTLVAQAPAGVHFEPAQELSALAFAIKAFAADSNVSPPANAPHRPQGERAVLARWLAHR